LRVGTQIIIARGLCDVVIGDNLETLDLVVGGAAPIAASVFMD
jgi:hypothetical protein